MRKSLKQLKQIFVDNKEYFIRCTLMSVIAALILGLTIGFAVPVSAADDSTENNQIVLPAGSYTWDINNISHNTDQDILMRIPFTLPPLSCSINGVNGTLTVGNFNLMGCAWDSDGSVESFVYFYYTDISGSSDTVPVYFNGDQIANANLLTINSYGQWETYVQIDNSGDIVPLSSIVTSVDASSYGRTFIVTEDTSIDSAWYDWISANTNLPANIPVIEAGYYNARDTFTISGWPVTNDSIEFRYYDELNQTYIEAEGIAFLLQNDIAEIYYSDKAVFTDGWNIEGAKYIQVLQDITVEPEFYTVFNNIYETSSQGSNEFESGYAAGYNDGFSAGRDVGYNQGYYEGMAESSGNFFADILGSVLGALDSFTLFGGYSLLDLITTLLGGFALIWTLKLLAGG